MTRWRVRSGWRVLAGCSPRPLRKIFKHAIDAHFQLFWTARVFLGGLTCETKLRQLQQLAEASGAKMIRILGYAGGVKAVKVKYFTMERQ